MAELNGLACAPLLLCIATHGVGVYFNKPRLRAKLFAVSRLATAFYLECRIDVTGTFLTQNAVEEFSP
jgi:hypothetical protein